MKAGAWMKLYRSDPGTEESEFNSSNISSQQPL